MEWGVPLYRLWGIRVRLHLFFLVFIVFKLLFAAFSPAGMGALHTLAMLTGLFTLVLLHEYGHCFACRWAGGEADDILLWPLGGLAYCRPPHRWKAALITTVGGPAVNAVLVPVFATALVLMGAPRESLIFNPFNPGSAAGGMTSEAMAWVWWFHYVNLMLLAFNVLCPMFPLDGGRILQELLWSRLGYGKSMHIASTVGLGTACVLGVLGMVSGETNLIMVALFGGLTCYSQRQTLRFAQEVDEPEAAWAASLRPDSEREKAVGPSKAELKRQEEDRRAQEEVDRILAKIRDRGMASLSAKEKRVLQQETERQRRG